MVRRLAGLISLKSLVLAGSAHGQAGPDTLRHADWHLYWHSEFNHVGDSSVVAEQWQFAYPWGRTLGGYEGEYYSGQQVNVDTTGVLHLRAQRRVELRTYQQPSGPVAHLRYDSGMLYTRLACDSMNLNACGERKGFTYGLFEIRCRLPHMPNSFPAFWLYGRPDEVDIFEAGGGDLLSNNVFHNYHEFWRPAPDGVAADASQSFFYWPGTGHLTDDFHTIALSWKPRELVYYFDGRPIRHETRLLPIGCSMELIANLAIFNWASAAGASFDIDYIRIYKQRTPPVQEPIWPVVPAPGILRGPRSTEYVANDTPPEQRWWVLDQPGRRTRLELLSNHNPRNFYTLTLPYQGQWLPSLVTFNEADSPRHWVASPDSGRSPLQWAVLDLRGHTLYQGQQPAALGWELQWPALEPGAYWLVLQIGARQLRQPLYQVGKPAASVFTAEWLAPPPPAVSAGN